MKRSTVLSRFFYILLFSLVLCAIFPSQAQAATLPGLNINVGLGNSESPSEVGQSIQVLILLTILALVPSILVLMTSFTRIVIVLSFTRNALGTQNMPPNQVVTGLALILTFFVMSPILGTVYNDAWVPYSEGKINLTQAASIAEAPLKKFMLLQAYPEDVNLFVNMAPEPLPQGADIPFHYVLPAFIISELKTAFWMGFMIYVPFLIIDMVVASTLMSMGMMMLPPAMISLPFKVLLFTLVSGWNLVVNEILKSFVW